MGTYLLNVNEKNGLFGRLLLAVTVFVGGCRNNFQEQHLSLKTLPPFLLLKKGVEIFQYWEFSNGSYLWDTSFTQPSSLKLYEDSVSTILGKETFTTTLQNLAFQGSFYQGKNTQNGDSINAQLIHSNTLGKTRPINYLESELVDYQISRYPLFSHPTEFHGFILVHDSLHMVRVY